MKAQLTHAGENPAAPAPPPARSRRRTRGGPPNRRGGHGFRPARLVLGTGRSIRVLTSYPVRRGLGLHSLATMIRFRCACCGLGCEATLIATRRGDGELVCPSCYFELGREEGAESGA